jgi:hypothetical protein
MKTQILDFQKLKKFSDEKRHMETIWADDHSTIKLICLKPGQEISTHTHYGNYLGGLEAAGVLSSDKETQVIDRQNRYRTAPCGTRCAQCIQGEPCACVYCGPG